MSINITPIMIVLEKIERNYIRDINQLEDTYSNLMMNLSQLSEIDDNDHIDALLEITEESLKNIREALDKLLKARGNVEEYIKKYQAYMEVDF